MAKDRKPGWWYPYIFVAGFGVVLAVNGALAYFATSTFTGLSTDNAYEKGRLYNRELRLAKAQSEMGWTVTTHTDPVDADKPTVKVSVTYLDRDGKPVTGMKVTASMIRPTTAGYDHDVALADMGGGVYGGAYVLPLRGVWDMDFVAIGADSAYQHAQRFVIP